MKSPSKTAAARATRPSRAAASGERTTMVGLVGCCLLALVFPRPTDRFGSLGADHTCWVSVGQHDLVGVRVRNVIMPAQMDGNIVAKSMKRCRRGVRARAGW